MLYSKRNLQIHWKAQQKALYESTYLGRPVNGKAVCISYACYAMSSSHFPGVIFKQKTEDTGTKGTYPTRNRTASQSCRQELPSEKPFQA